MLKKEDLYQELVTKSKKYMQQKIDLELIEKAYTYGCEKHKHQKRASGEAYICHPLSVAIILSELRTDPETIVSGILHDTIEDTEATYEEINELFNFEIAEIVQGVTKLNKIKKAAGMNMNAENHRKIFVAMSEDIRVILVKLADRLHNMRTLGGLPFEKQSRIAKETLDIYTPIAHRLGMYSIKNELEDLALRYTDPEYYYRIVNLLNQKKQEREIEVEKMCSEINKILGAHKIEAKVSGRAKSIYSIYKKIHKNEKRFEEIYDLLAIRIIAKTEMECYHVLGMIHALYKPIPGRFKDYIALPKNNMYQSLHTTVFVAQGVIFEIQIRTKEMNDIAEEGIAAHWSYKEKVSQKVTKSEVEEKLSWFKSFLNMQKDSDNAEEFIETVKNDVFQANIYVFTPKGDVIQLPAKSTIIDFAYHIHTDVGHAMVQAHVNKKLVPLYQTLKTGDIVEVKTSSHSFGPSEDWLKFAHTSGAKNKIKKYFYTRNKEHYIQVGHEKLTREMALLKIKIPKKDYEKDLKEIATNNGYKILEEFYAAIGGGQISARNVANKIRDNHEDTNIEPEFLLSHKKNISEVGVIVEGIDSMKVKLSACCNPINGDEIIGYISKGFGIIVHRSTCKNLKSMDLARTIPVYWAQNFVRKYTCLIIVQAQNRNRLLIDIMSSVSESNSEVTNISTRIKNETVFTELELGVNSVEALRKAVANLLKINGVISVERKE